MSEATVRGLLVGDVVCLRSEHGVKMTVNRTNDDGMCECVWFDCDERLYREWIHSSALFLLELIKEDEQV